MQPKLSSEPKIEKTPKVLDFIKTQARSYALDDQMRGHVATAGAQAFCAVCMTNPDGEVMLELNFERGMLKLNLGFSAKGCRRPYGLAQALFAPLHCRVKLEQEDGLWMWTATWEVQP